MFDGVAGGRCIVDIHDVVGQENRGCCSWSNGMRFGKVVQSSPGEEEQDTICPSRSFPSFELDTAALLDLGTANEYEEVKH